MREITDEMIEAWRRDEVQALGASLSLRNWNSMERAYNSLRDKMDRALAMQAASPVARNAGLSDDAVERVAIALCKARGEAPQGSQVRFVDGGMHSATFLQIAEADVRTVIAALTAVEEQK